eukprot:9472484-Pyramimonas_sp.AAC.1
MKGGPGVLPEISLPLMNLKLKLKNWQQFHRWRAGRFQNVVLALAPRTFVLQQKKSFTDRGRVVFIMWLSP